jgi:hypothetical protein
MTDIPARRSDFGAGRLFLADSRLALALLNYARHRALNRLFGVSREQANLLTFILAIGATHVTITTAGRVIRAPFRISGTDVATGGFLMREGAVGIAGPSASEVSPFATLLIIALAGGVAIPTLRRASHKLRATELRVRTLRERQYSNARRGMAAMARPAARVRTPPV